MGGGGPDQRNSDRVSKGIRASSEDPPTIDSALLWRLQRVEQAARQECAAAACHTPDNPDVLAAGGNVVLLVSDPQKSDRSRRSGPGTDRISRRGRAEAAAARQSLQNLTESVDVVVALMQERYPDLTGEEALDRVAEEIRELSERSADFEDQLTGLKMYRDVAELNVLGDPGTAGSGLRYSSALTRALEGSWDERDGELYRRCDQTSLAKFLSRSREPSRPSRLHIPPLPTALLRPAPTVGASTLTAPWRSCDTLLRSLDTTAITTKFTNNCEVA